MNRLVSRHLATAGVLAAPFVPRFEVARTGVSEAGRIPIQELAPARIGTTPRRRINQPASRGDGISAPGFNAVPIPDSTSRTKGLGVVFVTRSLAEAIFLAGPIVVMSPAPDRIVAKEPFGLERHRDVFSDEFSDIRRHLGPLPCTGQVRAVA